MTDKTLYGNNCRQKACNNSGISSRETILPPTVPLTQFFNVTINGDLGGIKII